MPTVIAIATRRLALSSALCASLLALSPASLLAQAPAAHPRPKPVKAKPTRPQPSACAPCIRAEMEFLAGDALLGRGSGTRDEFIAATYIASQLRAYGIAPAGDSDGYIQQANVVQRSFKAAPQLKFSYAEPGQPAQPVVWTHGDQMIATSVSQPAFSGPLQKVDLAKPDAKANPGAVVLLQADSRDKVMAALTSGAVSGAAGILVLASPNARQHWHDLGKQLPEMPAQLEGSAANAFTDFSLISLSSEAFDRLKALPDGVGIEFSGEAAPPSISHTWNAVGLLRGKDPAQQKNAILLTAHLDHLGKAGDPGSACRPTPSDTICNGADDDASGVIAVLELARVLGAGPALNRPVIFALFGSEETGGLGSTYFLAHPPVPLQDIAANLEFEMIGRPDPKVPPDTLWLTGWERSTLGPALAAHGAKLVADPHPEQGFFQRSDNIVLAKKGVVAQTVSSYGLHSDYHQPSDDVAHLDFSHITAAIQSMFAPVEWLVNSTFRPEWNPGGKP